MDGRQFEGLLQTFGHSRRAFVTALLAVSGGMVGSVSAEAGKNKKGKHHRRRRRRTRRITLCYLGETIRVNPAKKRLYHGATPGPCTCSTCEAVGKTCGPIDNACGEVSCGVCGVGDQNSCNSGSCDTCAAVCAQNCLICSSLVDGSTVCATDSVSDCNLPCMTDADCPVTHPTCVSGEAYRSDNSSRSWPADCGVAAAGVCTFITLC